MYRQPGMRSKLEGSSSRSEVRGASSPSREMPATTATRTPRRPRPGGRAAEPLYQFVDTLSGLAEAVRAVTTTGAVAVDLEGM
jgi:hypothetical protein